MHFTQKLQLKNKLILLLICWIQNTMGQSLPKYNTELRFIKGVDSLIGWKGNQLHKGRYVNHEFPMTNSFTDVWKWKKKKNPYETVKKKDTFQLPVASDLTSILDSNKDGIFWLGHATFVIRFGGRQFITDPVFNKATVVKRESPLPIDPKLLPETHTILMSHDHRDHCDKTSLRKLKMWNPKINYYSGLNMSKLLGKFLNGSPGQVAGWYQQYKTDGFELYFLPTRHWSKRSLNDTNKRLWGSFILKINGVCIYFGGDSGYGSQYKDIAKLFPEIDYAILGIGAYEPEWFMESNHSSPEKAYQAFLDLGAKYLIPMHYGTFDLSDEPIGKPQEVLESIKIKKGDDRVIIPQLGGNLFTDP